MLKQNYLIEQILPKSKLNVIFTNGKGEKMEFIKLEKSENFIFNEVPALLCKKELLSKLSFDAKLLYSDMLNKTSFSEKNNWIDKNDRLYIYYSYEEGMNNLNRSRATIAKALQELRAFGLIETVRQPNKQSRIYVLDFAMSIHDNIQYGTQFSYFTSGQGKKYRFYKIPRIFFVHPKFNKMSSGAKLLFGMMLSRVDLSRKNHWADKNGTLYIMYTYESIMKDLGVSRATVSELLKELKRFGLIRISRRGFGRPSKIYIADFMQLIDSNSQSQEEQKEAGQKLRKRLSREERHELRHRRKEKEKPRRIRRKPGEQYSLDYIREYYDYDAMLIDYPKYKGNIDSCMAILYEAFNSSKPTIRVCGELKDKDIVVSKLLMLSFLEIIYCIHKYEQQCTRIKNPSAYMLTLLYTAKEQMDLDVTNEVNSTMYG
jgi:predicted transcriptional regulator